MTVPRHAWSVIYEIREHVPRPEELPTPGIVGHNSTDICFGWELDGKGHKCPLGLLPYALDERPSDTSDFDADCPFRIDQAEVFWRWWDAQRDPEEAVAEVWDRPLPE